MRYDEEMTGMIDILYSMKENIRLRIFDLVFSSAQEGISFKGIVEKGNLPPTTAAYHLKVLSRSGIIEKRFKNVQDRRDYSFYHSTPLGDRTYFLIRDIYSDLVKENEEDLGERLPDIMVIPLRFGPRCISVEKI